MAKASNDAAPDTITFEDAASAPDTINFEDAQTGGTERGPVSPAPGAGSPTLPASGAPKTPIGSYPYTQQPARGGYWPAGTERTPFQAPVITGDRNVDVAMEPLTGIHHRIAQAFQGARDKLFMPGMADVARGDLSGLAGVVPGAAGMAFAPVGGILEPLSRPINEYAAPAIQSVFGTPPEITTPVLTALIPGLGVTKVPGMPRVPEVPNVKPTPPPTKGMPPNVAENYDTAVNSLKNKADEMRSGTKPSAPSANGWDSTGTDAPAPKQVGGDNVVDLATQKKLKSLDGRISKIQRGIDSAQANGMPDDVAAELDAKLAKLKEQRDALVASQAKQVEPPTSEPTTLIHSTSKAAADSIRKSGVFDPSASERSYNYSDMGPEAVYFSLSKDGEPNAWAGKGDGDRLAEYTDTVRAELDPKANVVTIKNYDDWAKLATRLGYENGKKLYDAMFADGLKEPGGAEAAAKKYAPLKAALRKAGIDAIRMEPRAENPFDMPAGNQLGVFNHSKLKVLADEAPKAGKAPDTVSFEEAAGNPALKDIQDQMAASADRIEKLQRRIAKAEDEGRDTAADDYREQLDAEQEAYNTLEAQHEHLQRQGGNVTDLAARRAAEPAGRFENWALGMSDADIAAARHEMAWNAAADAQKPPAGSPGGEPPPSPPGPPTGNTGGGEPPGGQPPIPPEKPVPVPTVLDHLKWIANRIEQILSPTTVDQNAGRAEAIRRELQGNAERDMAQADASFKPFKKMANKLSEAEQYDFIDYVENRTEGTQRPIGNPKLQPLADTMRRIMQTVQAQLEALPATEKMRFVTDFFPHAWENDPKTIAEILDKSRGGTGKEGTTGFTKKRTIPTVAEGLRAGLRLKNPNPIEATMQYLENASKFLVQGRMFQQGRDMGIIRSFKPGKAPTGWTELTGRLGGKLTPAGQVRYYAPDGFALIYNNAISPKFQGAFGDLMDGFQRISNFTTATELGLSGYHALTMTQESMVNSVALAIENLVTGHPIKAIGNAITAPLAPIRDAFTGGRMQRIYTGEGYNNPVHESVARAITPGDARLEKSVDLMTRAGGRLSKIDESYLASRQGDYVTAFKNGALSKQFARDLQNIAERPIVGTALTVARHIARIMDTASAPMFKEWIPRLKNGAFDRQMSDWLARNPNATDAEQLAQARKLVDSIDNRFGEMVKSNIFWRNTLKQSMQIALRSYTWTFGSVREIAGGVWDAAKQPMKAANAAGKYLEGKPVAKSELPGFTPRMYYAIALPLVWAMWNGVTTYLYTGEMPHGDDFKAGRTGGTSKGKPERVTAPGYMKDVLGWTEKGVLGELYNKTATVPRLGMDLATNKDWRGLPIAPGSKVKDPKAPNWLVLYLNHVADNLGPFSVKNIMQGQPKGSHIGPIETLLGMQPAGQSYTNPRAHEAKMRYFQTKEWNKKVKADRKAAARYNGPQ